MTNRAFTLIEVMAVLIITCVFLVIIFAGCQLFNASHITEGTVVWKRFVPEHAESETHYVETYGENSVRIPITTTYTVPDSYTIGLRGKYKDKTYVRTVSVDRQSYKLIREGQHFKISDLPLIPTAEEPND